MLLRRWRAKHLLLAWGAYWLALGAIALGPPGLTLYRVASAPGERGTLNTGLRNAMFEYSIADAGVIVASGSISTFELSLWIAVPPLLLWTLWSAARARFESTRSKL